MPRILLVKTSSLGDVIHNLPVATDIRAHIPGAEIDWIAEEAFAAVPAMHPGVTRVLPVALRRWRKALASPHTWREMGRFQHDLQSRKYDLVLDSQGLLKSALLAKLASGMRCGLDRGSAREPLATLLYDQTFAVRKDLHAVERNRLLAARALGYALDNAMDYGIAAPALPLPWLPAQPYAVLLHATSRSNKQWEHANWLELGNDLNRRGLACILPWGNRRELAQSRRLAGSIPGAIVPPQLKLEEIAALLARARIVVGVDTGITHLAAALKIPVVAIYCASHPELTGVCAKTPATNLGEAGNPPSAQTVISATQVIEEAA